MIPQYQALKTPEFSQGWLTRFKQRYGIQRHIQHGEAGSVPSIAEEEMKAVRTLYSEYLEDNIYNMDETGLYWRAIISIGLSI